ncbi:putative zinc-ribbon domain [Parasponia andersonii]|uniref:Putative zinc-ribbon domain n=1 Tax=Parasponia andersonii TaxID=3476 RepID=A0A2P5B0F8_PARAD|nr:putative zinc-ribbon domain [Parasponia andersonii]
MADPAKVRLVRCPKCGNLLPELADYSVYQCGGCGAVLRAKIKRQEGDTLSEKSDEERVSAVSAKLEHCLEKRAVDLCDATPNSDVVKSSSGPLGPDQNDCQFEKEDVKSAEIYRNGKVTADEWVDENGIDMNMNRDELGNALGRELGDLNPEHGSTSVFRSSGRMTDWKVGGRGEREDFGTNPRAEVEGVRFSTSNHPEEGPSNYQLGSSHDFGESLKKYSVPDGSRAPYLEQDRAELLKKLDELRDQLSRSCDMVDKPKEKVPVDGRIIPPDPYGGSEDWFPDGSSGPNRGFKPYVRPDKHVIGSPNFCHYAEPFPYNNGYEMPAHNLYPSMHYQNHVPGYGDPFGSQMLNGGSRHFPRPYQQPSHPYFSGQYTDNNPDPFEPYSHNAAFHQPSCSCFHCYDKHRRVSAPVAPSAFSNRRFADGPSNPMLYHHESPGVTGPSDPSKYRTGIHPNLHVGQSHTRWPSDLNHEMGYVRNRARRAMLATGGRRFHPLGAGAPFLTCSNCFEVLKLPKKVRLMGKTHHKVKCGTCSTVMDLAIVDKKIVLSTNSEKVQLPMEVNNGFNEVVNNGTLYSHGHMNRTYANFSSDDYDNSGYDFQSMDREPVSPAVGPDFNSTNPQEMQSFHSSSPCTSEDENSPEVLIAAREVTNSVQHPVKTTLSTPPAGSPLQEHFDFSSNNHLVNRFGKGNQSSRSEQEKVKPNKITSRQNSLKEASLATEMEVSFNEYSNTGISQDSGDGSRVDDQPKANKGGESFFANIKKSFRDLSRSNPNDDRGKCSVSVNGHPISDRVLKKAEKQAGHVQPGQYWYDYRAGFWGVMGGPCLGIIPPYIEEFNYPIPEDCAAGDTGVFVNGRELHQKDLDLLASRGMPTSRDRSYIIEISGRVLDEDTGEELDCLGKLAPTIEKVKHGFGMKPPKMAAS